MEEIKTYKIKWESNYASRKEQQGYQTRSIKDSKKKITNTTSQRFLGRLPSDIGKLLTSVYFNSKVPSVRLAVTEDKPG